MEKSLKIKLNEEQTKKFLSFFVKEAFEIIKKREWEQEHSVVSSAVSNAVSSS